MPSVGIASNTWPWDTASVIAKRAKRSRDCRSVSERDRISSFFAGFEHAQLAALLDAIVDLAPETEKVLRGGAQRADNHEPEQEQRQRIEGGTPRSRDQHSHGANL